MIAVEQSPTPTLSGSKTYLKVYGERNTNTNYIEKLITINLKVKQIRGVAPEFIQRIQAFAPGNEQLLDLYFRYFDRRNLGWKHCQVPAWESLARTHCVRRNKVAFITITKNPYSWLWSLYRKPYHQYYKSKPSFEEFLKQPWKSVRRDKATPEVSSPVELWNVKNRSYLPVRDWGGINLRTEEIFEDAEQVIEKIARHFAIERLQPHFVNYERSTKDKAKDSQYYRDYYLQEKWREHFSDQAIRSINQQLDKRLMDHFGYEWL